MSDIITAIFNIANLNKSEIFKYNCANTIKNGNGLSHFINDAFANTFSLKDTFKNNKNKVEKYSNIFSYSGTSRIPPDRIIKNGDAIIIKSIDNILDNIIFYDTHPQNVLINSSPSLNKYCRDCEPWEEKDIIYTITHRINNQKKLSTIWLIYGSIYLANKKTYLSTKNQLTKIDPLNNTSINIPNIWNVKSPVEVFDYAYPYESNLSFQLVAIIPSYKYDSFTQASRDKIEKSNNSDLKIKRVNIKNPNNPIDLIPCKLITYKIQQ